MEVYIEWTYLMNGFIILWTWEILCFLLNQLISIKKLMFYVLLYNVSLVLLYMDMFNGWILLYDLVISIILFRKLAYIYYPLYIFIYISLVSFMHFMIYDSLVFQGILLVRGLTLSVMMIVSVMAVVLIYFYFSCCKSKMHDDFVEVVLNHKRCLGFVDNGNKVTYQGCPVIFMNDDLIEGDFVDRIEIEVVNHRQVVDIVQVKDILIDGFVLHDVYIGILYDCEYDCILNNQLLGGFI